MLALLWCAITMPGFGAGCRSDQVGEFPSPDTARLQRYFEFNQLAPGTLRTGMTRDEVYSVLGPPTGRKGGGIETWYHNPKNLHVAPYIRIKFDGDVARAIYTGRG
jgi:hypothetical protein